MNATWAAARIRDADDCALRGELQTTLLDPPAPIAARPASTGIL